MRKNQNNQPSGEVKFNQRLEELEEEKRRIIKQEGIVRCPRCRKYYKITACKSHINWDPDMLGWYDDTEYTCPERHVFWVD